MIRILCLLLVSVNVWATDIYVCAGGTGDGSSAGACKAPGDDFASVAPNAGDRVYICGVTVIREPFTITSTNNVTVDLDCNGDPGSITGSDLITSFEAADVNGEYATSATFTVPMWVLLDGTALKEGVRGSLADNEWAFNSTNGGTHEVYLGTNPAGRSVEIAVRGIGIEFITSTGATVTGGRIYGIRHTGSATGNAGVVFRDSSGTVDDTDFYAVRRPTDVTAAGSMTVTDTTTSYCGDGPDANKNTTAPTLVALRNEVSDCNYGTWFTNTETSHGITIDGEGIACTNCAAFTVLDNTISRTFHGVASRVDAGITQLIQRNFIRDTQDEGLNLGCTNSSGVLNIKAVANVIKGAGKGGGYATSSYSGTVSNGGCGNGADVYVANNSMSDSSSGFLFTGDASQTGTIRHINNVISNVNPELVAGTHYFVNWNSISATHALTITSDANDYHQSYGVGFFRWVAGSSARSYANYASYLTDSSKDATSILTAPSWTGGVSPTTAAGFRAKAGSALRAAGTPLGPMQDYGNRRFRDVPSIGAWESASGDEATTRTAATRTASTARTAATARTAR